MEILGMKGLHLYCHDDKECDGPCRHAAGKTAAKSKSIGEVMKGLKNFWLPATFGLLFACALSLPAEAAGVPIVVHDAPTIKGIGDLTGNPLGYDQVGFTGDTTVVPLPPDLVQYPPITLGTLSFKQEQNCGVDPDGVSVCASSVDNKKMPITVTFEGQTQTAYLTFNWLTHSGPDENGQNPIRDASKLVFSSFLPSPLIFRYGFDYLVVTLLQPQDIIVPSPPPPPGVNPAVSYRDIMAILTIPEPSSLPLFGIGLAALAVSRRLRGKASSAV